MGTILRYVRARRHAFRTSAHRLPASGERAHRFFQLPVGAKERRAVHFAHRGHGCRAQRARFTATHLIAELRWLGLRVGRGAGGRRSVRALPAVRARRLVSGAVRPLGVRRARLPLLSARPRSWSCRASSSAWRAGRRAMPGPAAHLTAAERAARLRAGRKPTLRFAVPDATVIEFTDLVHGPQRFSSDDIGDFIIRREDGTSAFFFCNAVDDSVDGRHARAARRRSSHQYAAPTDAARRLGHAPARLRPRRFAGRRGRRAPVQAARQHQRAGVSRARISAGGAAQSSVPPGAHGRRRRLACRPREMPAHFRPGASRPRAGAIRGVAARALAEGDVAAHVGRRDRRAGWACRTRRRSSSWCATTWCCPRMRRPGWPWCAASCRRSAPRSGASSLRRGANSSRRRRRHWIDRARICTHSPQC